MEALELHEATTDFEFRVATAGRLLGCDLSVGTATQLMTNLIDWDEDDVWDAIEIAARRAPREIHVNVPASARRRATQPAPA